MTNEKYTAEKLMQLENDFGAHNYHPVPVVIERGEGVYVWDTNDKRYYDFLSAYSAVNQGHCHPLIIDALIEQSKKLTLTSRAFYNSQLGIYEKFMSEYFGFEMMLPMNTGAEAVETALKLCRKWAYEIKGVAENQARILVCSNNFHGRTTTIVSFSIDPVATKSYGPFTPGFTVIPYNDVDALEKELAKDPNIAGFLVEPIQGEAGVNVPDDAYLKKSLELCKKHNVLFMADEIQTGLARTGKLLACDYDKIKPDVLILGKALSGGTYPVSAVLADRKIMKVFKPGQHGSTYGGNPLAAAVAIAALKVIINEDLAQKSYDLGLYFREEMEKLCTDSPIALKVRGKGLMNALIIDNSDHENLAWEVCVKLAENGLLAKPTHTNIIRFTPPLVITKNQLGECIAIIVKTVRAFE